MTCFLALCLLAYPAFGAGPTVFDLEGRPVEAFAADGATRVFVFVRIDCPISNRYAPELARLAAEFADSAAFYLVHPDPAAAAAEIRQHAREFALRGLEPLRDPQHRLVQSVGARITPEVAVYRGTSRVYRGRIDDRWVAFGKQREQPTRRDLHEVLTALRDGEPVTSRETAAVGCHIGDLAP